MRMLALLRKELADERQNLALFVPTLIVGFVAVALVQAMYGVLQGAKGA